MEILKFKTSVKCNGCISNVTPFLSGIREIKSWNVDLNTVDKVLTVEGDGMNAEIIVSALREAGYKAEQI